MHALLYLYHPRSVRSIQTSASACLLVCLSVHSPISKQYVQTSLYMLPVVVRGSGLVWRQCNTSYSGFMNDFMFSHDGPYTHKDNMSQIFNVFSWRRHAVWLCLGIQLQQSALLGKVCYPRLSRCHFLSPWEPAVRGKGCASPQPRRLNFALCWKLLYLGAHGCRFPVARQTHRVIRRAAVWSEFLSPYPPHTHTHVDPHGDPQFPIPTADLVIRHQHVHSSTGCYVANSAVKLMSSRKNAIKLLWNETREETTFSARVDDRHCVLGHCSTCPPFTAYSSCYYNDYVYYKIFCEHLSY